MDTDRVTIAKALNHGGWDTFGASVDYNDGTLGTFYRRGFERWEWLSWSEAFPVDSVRKRMSELKEPWFSMLRPMDLHERRSAEYDYRGLVGELDKDMGMLVAETRERFPNTVVCLTADHGQGLGERGMWNHREHLWWFLTHVPLVWAGPGVLEGRSGGWHQHMDTTATIAGLAGVDFHCEGVDWSRFLHRGELPKLGRDHVVMFSLGSETATNHNYSTLWAYRSLRCDGWVLHVDQRGDEIRKRLYSTSLDPEGTIDLSEMGQWQEMLAQLEIQMGWPDVPGITEGDEEVILERLRALGYAD